MMAGRNAGKSYAGARWLHRKCSVPGKPKRARIIAPSFGDAVASCVEGPSGILEASNSQAKWKPSHPGGAQVQWPNGSVCYVIGTPTPRDVDRLRAIGNIDYDWFEEAAANPQLPEAERQARLSRRRLGSKWICTTTPRPLPEISAWEKDPTVAISAATAFDNPHADPLWLEELETMYAGTRLYDQEVLGKVLTDVAGALWNVAMIERSRIRSLDDALNKGYIIQKKVVGVDPGNTTGITGIVVVALALKPPEFEGGQAKRHLLVLEDLSMPAASAEAWAAVAVKAAIQHDAVIVAENDSGGDAIRAVLKGADHLDRITVIPARARGRGSKDVRAEPISILWERDDFRGHIVGELPQLEDQMSRWVPDDKKTAGPSGSPDRVDALVWACTYLWTRNGAEDIEVHLPSHMSGTRQNPLQTRPGMTAPWNNRGRKKHARSAGHSR
jgi:phage terminase large subunit-like protein